jgi:hypothetical protein
VSALDYAGSTGDFTFVMSGTAGQTANAFGYWAGSTTGVTGWTAGSGYFDTLRVFGPSYAFNGPEYSAFATSAAYTAFLDEVDAGKTYIKVSTNPAGASAGINFAHVTSKSVNTTSNYVDLLISKVAVGVAGPTSTSISWFYINGSGVTAGGTVGVGLIPSMDFTVGADTPRQIYAGLNSSLYQNNLSGLITDGDGVGLTGSTATTPPVYGYAQFTRVSTNNLTGSTFSGIFTTGPVLSQLTNYVTVEAFVNVDFTGPTAYQRII